MSAQHTPGPWRIKSDPMHFDTLTTVEGGAIGVRKPFGVQMIVQVGGDSDFQEAEANARLIAAAPELLDLLNRAVRRLEIAHANGDTIMREWIVEARAAIAKVEGEKT